MAPVTLDHRGHVLRGWEYGTVRPGSSAVLLVHEAGGVVLTLDGPVQDFPPVGAPFLVAHPGAADELFQVWTAAVTGGGSAS